MRKAKTYFEQVPLKVVEVLLRLQAEQKKTASQVLIVRNTAFIATSSE
jgi:hypothetical protein